MKKIADNFFTALGLVCRIPFPFRYEIDFTLFGFFLPWISAFAIGVVYLVSFIFMGITGDSFITALAALFVQYLVFNLFHFDGLLDSADALFCYADREKRLAILKDIQIGSFAFFIGICYLIAKVYLLSRLLDFAAVSLPLTILALSYPLSGRIASVLIPVFMKPAKKKGLGALLEHYSKPAAFLGTITALGALFGILYGTGNFNLLYLAIIPGILFSAVLIGFQYQRKIGGYTGDALGFAIELGELMQLFTIFMLFKQSI